MPDQKPPRRHGDERETLMVLLQFQRESIVRKVRGVDGAAASESPVGSGTSLLWLVQHLARAESSWVEERFAGNTPVPTEVSSTLDEAVDLYQATWRRVDAVIAAAPSLDETCRVSDQPEPVNLRWVIAHLLEETARHAGHADILRELIDGDTGR